MNIKRLPEHNQILSEIYTLQEKVKELERIEREEFQERAKAYVGKCYRYTDKDVYFKIINVPQVKYTLTGSNFNEYQFPAFYVDKETDETPFFNDTAYLNMDYGIPERFPVDCMTRNIEEIDVAAFNEILDSTYKEWISSIKNV